MKSEMENFKRQDDGIAVEEQEDDAAREQAEDAESPENNEVLDAGKDVIEANHDTMVKVLEMFGTDAARDRFLDLAEHHYKATRFQSFSGITGIITGEEKERATYHNAIMETLQRLSMSPKLTPEQQNILLFLSEREKVKEMIYDYYNAKPKEVSRIGMMRKGMFEDRIPPSARA